MGQAIRTTMVQLASEATGVAFGEFDLITQDTALTHPHRSASGQRQTLISGNAVVIAGTLVQDSSSSGVVAGWHELDPDELMIAGDEVRTQWSQYRREEVLMTLAEVAERAAAEGRSSCAPTPCTKRRGRGRCPIRRPGAPSRGGVPQLSDVRLRHPGAPSSASTRRRGRSTCCA